jgi:hypothetical protein
MTAMRRVLATILATAVALGGLIAVGLVVRDSIRERYSFAIHDIECQPPPGLTREAFLNEVHYYGQLPERLNTLDADCVERLTRAFERHPRVERVERIDVADRNRVTARFVPRD